MATGAFDKFKNFIGFGDEYEDYDDEILEEEPRESSLKKASPLKNKKVVPFQSSSSQSKIVVVKPKCYSDATLVADELKNKRPVIINSDALDTAEARRVIDFVAGTVYGLGGNMQMVAGGIFLATPSQYDIMGEVLNDGFGFEFSMFN